MGYRHERVAGVRAKNSRRWGERKHTQIKQYRVEKRSEIRMKMRIGRLYFMSRDFTTIDATDGGLVLN